MEISDRLRCLFTATVDDENDSYRIEIPSNELEMGAIQEGETYRVAFLPSSTSAGNNPKSSKATPEPDGSAQEPSGPPVKEGDTRTVEVADIGDQGDGIARVERGFVIIVPNTNQGDRVEIEITDVGETVAFATVTDRLNHL